MDSHNYLLTFFFFFFRWLCPWHLRSGKLQAGLEELIMTPTIAGMLGVDEHSSPCDLCRVVMHAHGLFLFFPCVCVVGGGGGEGGGRVLGGGLGRLFFSSSCTCF